METAVSKASISLKKGFHKKYRSAEGRIQAEKVVFIEPLTYMNKSGQILDSLRRKYQLSKDNLVVVCDNLDLEPGMIRIKRGGGTAGHNGLDSIIRFLGSKDFLRVYIGIGRPRFQGDVIAHVLGAPTGDEDRSIQNGIATAAEAMLKLIEQSPEQVMNEYNRRNTSD